MPKASTNTLVYIAVLLVDMSGLEIAGLVLGSIPLVIAALEHYEDIMASKRSFFSYVAELEHATRSLACEQVLFQQSMKSLLKPITRDHELRDMLDNTASPLWKESSINSALEDHLDIAFVTYMEVVQAIEAIIKKVSTKIKNLSGASNVKSKGLHAIISQHAPARKDGKVSAFEFSTALKFTMKKSRLAVALQELSRLNGTLRMIQTGADKLKEVDEIVGSVRNQSNFAIPLHVIRKNAAKVYEVLSRSWCSNHNTHCAGLLLEQRLVRKAKRGTSAWRRNQCVPAGSKLGDASRFGVSILRSCSSDKWLDLEIKPVEAEDEHQVAGTVHVRISAPDTSSSLDVHDPGLPFGDPAELSIVTDLCASLQRSCARCAGFYLDSADQLRGTVDTARAITYAETEVSLKDLLQDQLYQLKQLERYTLAITLIASLLQLAQTPWLSNSWSETDIVFLRARAVEPGFGLPVDVEHPYLARKQGAVNNKSSGTDSSRLLQLAVMLLEICYGRSICEIGANRGATPMTEIESFQVVRDWLTKQRDSGEISHAFLKAISYCHSCFADGSASLANDDLTKAIEEKVLFPLEEEMHVLLFGPAAR